MKQSWSYKLREDQVKSVSAERTLIVSEEEPDTSLMSKSPRRLVKTDCWASPSEFLVRSICHEPKNCISNTPSMILIVQGLHF